MTQINTRGRTSIDPFTIPPYSSGHLAIRSPEEKRPQETLIDMPSPEAVFVEQTHEIEEPTFVDMDQCFLNTPVPGIQITPHIQDNLGIRVGCNHLSSKTACRGIRDRHAVPNDLIEIFRRDNTFAVGRTEPFFPSKTHPRRRIEAIRVDYVPAVKGVVVPKL